MYFITETQWNKIPDDFKTENSYTHGGRACFESCINPDKKGTPVLIFENLHFVVVPNDILTGDTDKDEMTCKLLEGLSELNDDDRETWRRECMDALEGKPESQNFVNMAAAVIADRLSFSKMQRPGRDQE